MAGIPQVGEQAPDFTMRDEEGQEVKLSDQRGKTTVLVFFPLAFSGICEGEMCEIRDIWSEFEGVDAQVFGISRDSGFALKAWKEAKGLKNRFIPDMKGDVARLYGAWNEDRAIANRLTVVIDKDGKVSWTDQSPNNGVARNQHDAAQAAARAG